MPVKIFISRDLTADSVFTKILAATNCEIHGESLMEFTAVPFAPPPPVDWIFFYSKNAVRFFFTHASGNFAATKFAALGERTAATLQHYVPVVNFTGNGKPPEVANDFRILAQYQRVLFPRARQSRRSVQRQLTEQIEVVDLVVYDNQIRKNINLPEFDILVFTSPLNVRAYFNVCKYKKGQQLVAIGNTTAAALEIPEQVEVCVAEEASELGLARVVKEILARLKSRGDGKVIP